MMEMKTGDGSNKKQKGLVLFWLLGYPIGLAMFVAFSNLKLL
jgi:hypothetical protein